MAEKKAKATKRPKAGGPGGAGPGVRSTLRKAKAGRFLPLRECDFECLREAVAEKPSAEKPSAEKPSARSTSPKVAVVNAANETVREIQLSPIVFAAKPSAHLVYEAVKQHRAGARRGTHATKNRALVSGSGRKPWRQKGTGRARVGEIRTPLWRHGGTVFGPQPRDYSFAMPRKARAAALRAALSQRLHEGAVKVVEGFEVAAAEDQAAQGAARDAGYFGQGGGRRPPAHRVPGAVGPQPRGRAGSSRTATSPPTT